VGALKAAAAMGAIAGAKAASRPAMGPALGPAISAPPPMGAPGAMPGMKKGGAVKKRHFADGGMFDGGVSQMGMGQPGVQGGMPGAAQPAPMQAPGLKKGGKFIQKMGLKKNALHRELGVPEGKTIPASKLEAATHSSNPLLRKRANTAEMLKGLPRHHGPKKG
jgi:hypothetical protein